MRQFVCVIILFFGSSSSLQAQGTKEDFTRANEMRELTRNKVYRDKIDPQWSADGNLFWYRIDHAPGEWEFIVVDAAAGKRESAFDHARVAAAISQPNQPPVSADSLPVKHIEFAEGTHSLRLVLDDAVWRLNRATGELSRDEQTPDKAATDRSENRRGPRRTTPESDGVRSPDGQRIAFVRDRRVFVRGIDESASEAVALTENASPANSYNESDLFWSPDSVKLVALKTRAGDRHDVHFVESSPRDQLQPKLHVHDYLKPGDEIPQPIPHLFNVEKGIEIPVSHELFPNPWMFRPRIEWAQDSGRFYYVYNQRGHQVLRVLSCDADSGVVSLIVNETSPTFIDYSYKQFLHVAHRTDELIWMSERSGWNHLYLYDSKTGAVKNPITTGDWVVRSVRKVDEEKRQVWFSASGIRPEQDPYYVHECRVNFDGNELTVLTEGDGTHEVKFSPDRRFLIDTYSRVDLPAVSNLRETTGGTLICELEKADWSALLETGWKAPERFTSKARDGKTDIYGVIYRPTNFDDTMKYPVIEKIYAGPHGSFVPKEFSSFHSAQEIAQLGFIVVQIDGMGTSNRSKAFHDVCWKNLGDSGFPDRVLWIKAAVEKYPFMDVSRGVGIYGGSAGGQSSTRAVLAFGDFYTVAVSDCGCHDNRMDKIWWNELWMGWPIGPHYGEQSNVTNAHRLKGKLLLTVGEVDRNVDPASTMQVVDALIRADRDFDLLVVPGGGHGVGESAYGKRRRSDFFVRHLLGVEPRRD